MSRYIYGGGSRKNEKWDTYNQNTLHTHMKFSHINEILFFLKCMSGFFEWICICSAHESQDGAWEPLELELHLILSGHMELGTKPSLL